jgi:hypothetical protein
LFAEETNPRAKNMIYRFGADEQIEIRTYSRESVKELCSVTVDRLSLSFGLALPNPKNYTIGIVYRIRVTTGYDQLFLTPLDIEVNNIFSMDLMLKKNRMNLSFDGTSPKSKKEKFVSCNQFYEMEVGGFRYNIYCETT